MASRLRLAVNSSRDSPRRLGARKPGSFLGAGVRSTRPVDFGFGSGSGDAAADDDEDDEDEDDEADEDEDDDDEEAPARVRPK